MAKIREHGGRGRGRWLSERFSFYCPVSSSILASGGGSGTPNLRAADQSRATEVWRNVDLRNNNKTSRGSGSGRGSNNWCISPTSWQPSLLCGAGAGSRCVASCQWCAECTICSLARTCSSSPVTLNCGWSLGQHHYRSYYCRCYYLKNNGRPLPLWARIGRRSSGPHLRTLRTGPRGAQVCSALRL